MLIPFIWVQRVASGWLKFQIYGLLLYCVIYCSHLAWVVRVIGLAGIHCVPASFVDAMYRFTTAHALGKKMYTLLVVS